MVRDPADEWLRADAERRGVSVSDYERDFGVMVSGGPAEQRVAYNEIGAGLLNSDSDISIAHRHELRRLAHHPRNGRRDKPRPIRKAGRFATRAA